MVINYLLKKLFKIYLIYFNTIFYDLNLGPTGSGKTWTMFGPNLEDE